jgi:hypothetical protein
MKKLMWTGFAVLAGSLLVTSAAQADIWKIDIKCDGDWFISYSLVDENGLSAINGFPTVPCVNGRYQDEHDTGDAVVTGGYAVAEEIIGESTCAGDNPFTGSPITELKAKCETKEDGGDKEKLDFKAKKKKEKK